MYMYMYMYMLCRVGDGQMLRGYSCMSQEFFLLVQGLAFCLEAFIAMGLWAVPLCLSRQRAIARGWGWGRPTRI